MVPELSAFSFPARLEVVAIIVHAAHTTHASSHATHSAAHTSHPAHSTAARHRGPRRWLGRSLGHGGLGRQHHRSGARCILKCRAHDLRGIDHASFDEVFVDFGRSIETEVTFAFEHRVEDDLRFVTGVARDLPKRLRHRRRDNSRAGLFIFIESE